MVALKSLPPGTMLNIVGFGTTIKALFTSSKLCNDVSAALALLTSVSVTTSNTRAASLLCF